MDTGDEGGSGNQRRYLRYLVRDVSVRVRPRSLLGRLRAETLAVIDFNRFGLAFGRAEALETGLELLLDVDAGKRRLDRIPAVVRVCLPHEDGLRIGVEFDTVGMRRNLAERLEHDLHELEKTLKRR